MAKKRAGDGQVVWRALPALCLSVLFYGTGFVAGNGASAQSPSDLVEDPSQDPNAPRRWHVLDDATERFAAPSLQARVVEEATKGQVLRNEGCAQTQGAVWCETRTLRGNARAYVLRDLLEPATGPDGVTPVGLDQSKARAGKRDFDASGQVACAQERGQTLGTCAASVARGTGGDATVVVTFSNGFKRQLFYVHGQFVRGSSTMSGVGTDIDWEVKGDRHHLRVDDQQFEIDDTFLFGPGS